MWINKNYRKAKATKKIVLQNDIGNSEIYEKEPWYKETALRWTNFVRLLVLRYEEVPLSHCTIKLKFFEK